MATMVQIDVEGLYQQHEQLLRIEEHLEDLGREAPAAERELAKSLQAVARQILDQIEDVLDSDRSRAVMEDVQRHGAVPWEEVEAELER